MELANERPGRLPKEASAERRAGTRFPLTLDIHYAVLKPRGPVATGSGRTIDLSSSGLAFTADRPLLTGEKLNVSILWPVLLDGGVQLQLTISGKVVRTNGLTAALQIKRHEFRTLCGGLRTAPLRKLSAES